MSQFSGVEAFSFPRSRVAGNLSDARFLAACAPDATIRHATSDTAEWQAKAVLGFASMLLDTKLTVLERRPNESVTFELSNRTTSASMSVSTNLVFADIGLEETQVTWTAEVTARTGLLKLVPASVLGRQIESLLGDLWQNVRRQLQIADGPSVP